ncbi:hypothetical protein [Streptomyces puniciscabiei]|nr:hypothetical protein [Streptomyces puniciscabiei]
MTSAMASQIVSRVTSTVGKRLVAVSVPESISRTAMMTVASTFGCAG